MSTRATYRFEAGDVSRRASGMSHAPVTVYIHHDGYPAGAACYFWNMHHATSYDRTPLVCFIRANERAEVTEGHEAHGDTDYRYTLRGTFLTAQKRGRGLYDATTWGGIFAGEYHEFINQYGRGQWDEFETLRTVPVNYCEGYGSRTELLTRSQIATRITTAREELDAYRARWPDAIGNIRGHESTLSMWERALKDYELQEEFDKAKPANA